MAATPSAEPALAGTPVVMAERIEIFPAAPLPQLDAPHAKAYAARATGETRSSIYALVCSEDLPLRGDSFANFLNCDHASLVRFRDQGVVDWPLSGRREPVVIFSRPQGERLDRIYTAPQKPPSDEDLTSFFVRPIAGLLTDLAQRGLTHGNIQIGNIFLNATTGEAQLGEALSCPPSYSLPALYCTIERAQCPPAARGAPTSGDDIYAMGIVGLILAIGFNPWAQLSDDDILATKLDKTSFFGLLGEQRLRGTLVELFRGMLDDSPRRRWSMDDLQTWLSGRRPPPRSADETLKAVRPFLIGQHGYSNLRSVAHGLTRDVAAGAQALEGTEMEKWLTHSLSSDRHAAALRRSLATAQAGPRTSTYHDQMVARAAMVLDPQGPLRYRGLSLMPSGIGYYLGTVMAKGGNMQPIAEVIGSSLPANWVDEQEEARADHLHTLQTLEYARAMLEKRDIGFGLERVVYEMLPAMACLSPAVKEFCCRTVHDLLAALNRTAGKGRDLTDRHVIAFILAREKRIPPPLVYALSAPEGSVQRAIAVLRVMAEAQYRQGPEELPQLTEWMAGRLDFVARRFFERTTQEKARADMQAAARTGKLAKLLEALDSGDRMTRDRDMFEQARYQYALAEDEMAELQLDIDNRRAVEIKVGQPIASIAAAVVGFAAIGLVIMLTVMGIGM